VIRFLLLVPFLSWLIYMADPMAGHAWMLGAVIFLGGYVALIAIMGVWSRWVARHIDSQHFQSRLRRFNLTLTLARYGIVAWYAFALFGGLRWGQFLHTYLPILERGQLTLPAAIVATLPPYLAWMGLWWSQYPAERALREQGLLALLESDLPVHSPPRFWSWFATNVRMQILFMLVPVMLILFIRDFAFTALWRLGIVVRDTKAEPVILLGSSAFVFVFAPVLLTMILRTQTLPDSPLRRRLEDLCRRTRLRYRDILLWQTDNNMGNAAVMGLLPPVRYILLSDLLLESMTDEQVEAVFAHEVGHIVHRHMAWYVVLIVILMLGMSLAQIAMEPRLTHLPPHVNFDVVLNVAGFGIFLTVFGFLSRRFERQADVYAARTIERNAMIAQLDTDHVGAHGAMVFASALHRVAVVNNIPIRARNFTHGSIAARMNYLRDISSDPQRTGRFDRAMLGIYTAMVIALALFGSAAWIYRDKLMG
jgi:STE24 endopeptidase